MAKRLKSLRYNNLYIHEVRLEGAQKMGGISNSNQVKSGGIKAEDFRRQLQASGLSDEKQNQAMSIFNKYAGISGETYILDESEQALALAEFAQLDGSDNDKVTKREFKRNSAGTRLDGDDYKSYKTFMETMTGLIAGADESERSEIVIQDDNNVAVVDGAKTEDTADDAVRLYHIGENTEEDVIPENEGDDEEVITDPVVPEKTFKDEAGVKQAVYQYLTNCDDLTPEDIERLTAMNALDGLEISALDEGGSDKVKITFNGKDFYLYKDDNGYHINSETTDDSEGTTLQEEILNSTSTDNTHHYLNRHGSAGNTKSVYDKGTINNTSTNRQHVNPVQTFTSMILNNTEDSTLRFNNELKGSDIIDVVLGADATEKEISMRNLIKYIRAAVDEARTTTTQKKNFGTRTAAFDVDLDLKDLANIGIVFKKYDKSGNGKLNAEELDNLIKDLTHNHTMSELAKSGPKHEYSAPPEDSHYDPVKKPEKKPEPERLDANLTRKKAGSGEKIEYHYDKKTGTRSRIENGVVDQNKNYAVWIDHGPLGVGKKDFIEIEGLGPHVDAEVVDRKELKGNQVIRVRDKDDNVSYYDVTYDKDKGTYTLGVNKLITSLFGKDGDPKMKIPKNLTMEYKNGKATYKINGREVTATTARAHMLAANTKDVKQTNIPTDSPENIAKTEQALITSRLENPVKLKNKADVDALAKRQGLRETFGSKYGWYYSDSQKMHYYFDEATQKFIPDRNQKIIHIFDNGRNHVQS